jgi:Domain of unknown function (DUF4412)
VKSFSTMSAVVIGLVLGVQTVVSAGVVMSEVAIASGPVGKGTENRTVYVQGNKQKIDTRDIQTITDLDKGQLYIVDKDRKNYVEMPIESLSELTPGRGSTDADAIVLRRTGATHVIADNHCDEYRGKASNAEMDVTISACVSKVAPGANEIVKFDRTMVSQIQGLKPEASGESATGMVLEKRSVINLRVPVASRKGYDTASLITKTRVNDIEVKQLPAQTFMPPKGYNKVEDQPPLDAGEDTNSILLKQPRVQLPFALSMQSKI